MSSGFFAAANFSFTLSTRSSSTQPPDTEPTIWPSSRIATMAPIGRGAEPQVLTIVPSAARWPFLRQSSAVRSTSISTLSMGKCYRNATTLGRRSIGNSNARAMAGGAGLGPREREQLVRETPRADRRLVHRLELGAHFRRQRFRERELGVRLQARERRAQLMRGVGKEALLVAARLRHLVEQSVQRAHERLRCLGGAPG